MDAREAAISPSPTAEVSVSPGGDLEILPAAVIKLDASLGMLWANAAMRHHPDFPPRASYHMRWLLLLHEPGRRALVRRLEELPHGGSMTVQLQGLTVGRWFEIRATRTPEVDVGNAPSAVLLSFADVSEAKGREAALAYDASHDPLTGLYNRAVLTDRARRAVAGLDRGHGPVAVLYIDLQRFKQVNDEFGHAAGDRVLLSMADRLKGCVRPTDTLARVGGDEFVLLAEDLADQESACTLASRLVEVTSHPVDLDGRRLSLSATVGVAFAADASDDPASLVARADAAMYSARSHHQSVRVEIRPGG